MDIKSSNNVTRDQKRPKENSYNSWKESRVS